MVVRIQFGRGSALTHKRGKNARVARAFASLLTLVSICLFFLAAWRLGMDLGLTSDFAFSTGLASHWQVWMAAMAAVQYAAIRLNRYAKENPEAELVVPPFDGTSATAGA